MSKPRNYQTEAIIIKKTKLGEAERKSQKGRASFGRAGGKTDK